MQVVYRDDQWLVDNGNCKSTREVLYVTGFAPDKRAECKPNEVDVPPVVGRDDRRRAGAARTACRSTPERDHAAGEAAASGSAMVVEQFPKGGTLSSWGDRADRRSAQATARRSPDLVGLTLEQARTKLLKRGLVPEISRRRQPRRGGVVRAQRPSRAVAAGKGMRSG